MRRALTIATAITALMPAQLSAQPNILLIIADDMGLDASSCYDIGQQQAPMPNLETMCDGGMVFENAYAAPVCSPTRASIMTGQYGFRTGIGAVISRRGSNGLDDRTTSLFDVMASTDYKSNLIGKWHLAGADDGTDHPARLGVSDYFGLFSGNTRDYSNWQAVENGQRVQINEYSTTEFTNRAIDWIGAQQDDPWFLWLAYNAPHSPFHLPPGDLHDFDDLPERGPDARGNTLPYYQAMLQSLDTEIGRLMASIPAETRDETLVVFMGDNGSPNQVTRGFYGDHRAKGTLYEGGVHIPLVAWGAGVQAGRSDTFVNSTDLFATIASIAGADTQTADSFDFSPALTGGNGRRDYVYVELFSDQPAGRSETYGWAIRLGAYKLLMLDGQDPQLYDLSKDPHEADNLLLNGTSPSEQEVVDAIMSRYAELKTQN